LLGGFVRGDILSMTVEVTNHVGEALIVLLRLLIFGTDYLNEREKQSLTEILERPNVAQRLVLGEAVSDNLVFEHSQDNNVVHLF